METPGAVETTPMPSEGQRLIVNAEDRGLSDCRPLTEDGVRQPVHWKTRSALPSSRAIRIRFQLSNASLYSFSIV